MQWEEKWKDIDELDNEDANDVKENKAKIRVPETERRFNSKTLEIDGQKWWTIIFARLPSPCAMIKAISKAIPTIQRASQIKIPFTSLF